ncbi:TATA-binding protein-associated factor BTAF1 [Tanacetum coccineum]
MTLQSRLNSQRLPPIIVIAIIEILAGIKLQTFTASNHTPLSEDVSLCLFSGLQLFASNFGLITELKTTCEAAKIMAYGGIIGAVSTAALMWNYLICPHELHKLHHSPKLVALQEILEECGIGVEASTSEGSVSAGQHRVLIFAQHKALLDIIEKDLFNSHMKSVTYLRLDGSVQPEKRFDVLKSFNSDPTIDVLLLTTHVGGLGLNLTSADTLVFMKHDWNPMRVLQVRSSVKLLKEINDLLKKNPTRQRLFRRTVFGPWLDILSHDNDNHLMHYVLHHQSIELLGVLRHTETWIGLFEMDAVRVCLLLVAELVFMANHRAFHLDKKKQNLDYYPTYNLYGFPLPFKSSRVQTSLGVYIWGWPWRFTCAESGLSKRVVALGLVGSQYRVGNPDSNPNLELYATPVEQQTDWFKASIEYINGLVDLDMNVSEDDIGGDVSNNSFDLNDNAVSGNGNNDVLLLEGGDGFVDSVSGDKNHECNQDKQDKQDQQDKQPSLANVLYELRALRKEVALFKVDDARISKLERILNDTFIPCNDRSKGNHNAVYTGLSCSANDHMSSCLSPKIPNDEVPVASTAIHNANEMYDSPNCVTDNDVKKRIGVSSNYSMLNTSCPEMHNAEVLVAGMGIDKADDITPRENEFADDFMDVLNDEESLPKVSLDDMNVLISLLS